MYVICTSITLGYFSGNSLKCNSGECVPETCLCDGKVDCQDESDEEDCEYLP